MSSKRGFFSTIRHPKTKAQLAMSVFVLILLATLVVFAMTLFRNPGAILESGGRSSSLVVESGQAQLLEGFTKTPLLPENAATIRLDGLFLQQDAKGYATFTVDGITATLVEDDYIGGYQITDISAEGVTLKKGSTRVTLTMADNLLDLTHEK